jgi:hypothetical protein
MTNAESAPELDPAVLAAELLVLRRYGVRRGTQKVPLPVLEAAARRLSDDPSQPAADQIKAALEAAAKHMGEVYGPAVADLMDFGSGKRRRFLKNRREDVAAQLEVTAGHLYGKLEEPMLGELAGHVVRLAEEHAADIQARQQPDDGGPDVSPLRFEQYAPRHRPQRRLRWFLAGAIPLAIAVAVLGWLGLVSNGHNKAHAAQRKPTTGGEYVGLRKHVPAHDTQLEASIYAADITKHAHSYRAGGVAAEAGDQVALEAYFVNAASPGGLSAINIRLTVGLDQTEETRDHVVHVAVKAANAPEVKWATHVLTAEPTRLVLVPGTVAWKHNIGIDEARPHWITTHLNDYAITDPLGTIIDHSEEPANKFSETVGFRVAVERSE